MSNPFARPIRCSVEPQHTWTFGRGDERLVLQRHHTEDGPRLVVMTSGRPTVDIPFRDVAALEAFQSDMEEVLVHTGWSLIRFEPESRVRDRRHFPRVNNDRRRWWTDPVPARRR